MTTSAAPFIPYNCACGWVGSHADELRCGEPRAYDAYAVHLLKTSDLRPFDMVRAIADHEGISGDEAHASFCRAFGAL